MATNKRIVIEYDINRKPIDVAIDKTLNLQQQVKELTKALRSVKEGSAEFRILSNRLGEAQDQLQKTGVKSRDLLGSLQLIPGPVGQIASELNGAISLLKVFSSFSLKDIQFQFKETTDDIKDIFNNLFGVANASGGLTTLANKSKDATNATDDLNKATKDSSDLAKEAAINYGSTVAAQTSLKTSVEKTKEAIEKQLTVQQRFDKLLEDDISIVGRNIDGKYQLAQVTMEGTTAFRNLETAELELLATTEALTISEDGKIVATEASTVATNANTTATVKASAASKIWTVLTNGLAKALMFFGVAAETAAVASRALLTATGIGAFIAIISYAYTKLSEFIDKFNEIPETTKAATKNIADFRVKTFEFTNTLELAKQGLISKKKALEEYNSKLGATIGYAGNLNQAEDLYNANTAIAIESIRLRAMAQVLYAKAAENSAKAVTGEGLKPTFWDSVWNSIKAGGSIMGGFQNNVDQFVEGISKANKDANDLATEADNLTKKAIENDKKKKKGLLEPPKEGGAGGKTAAELAKERYNISLRELDALIKLEIDKNKTRENILDGYLLKRKQIQMEIAKLDKQPLSSAEVAVIEAENRQKVLDAIIEDNVRVIQAEIDKYNRLTTEAGIGTKQYFDARREVARTEFEKEFEEARKDEKTRETKQENARTNYWKKLIDIDKEGLQALAAEKQVDFDAQTQNSQDFFNRQRDLEMANYAVRQADARDNYDKLELLKQEHEKKMRDIDVEEIQYQADIYGRKAKVQQEIGQKDQKYTIESLFTKNNAIRKLNEERFDNEIREENNGYEAKKLAAKGNVKELETIEYEHAATLREIDVRKKEANQQVLREITQVTAQFGQTLGQIGDAIMQDQQGRDKKKFEMGKKIAIAGIGIEKAAAIASIWSNNAIANAKAVAAFPLVAGQPWVTINTVSAALSTAATIAAAIQAISQINGTSFEAGDTGSQSNLLGRNYEKGGYIKGPRHAQGGVMLEAEGGEAIMTRGAVTMFAPLLSAMNQMGGGTAFTNGAVGQAANDNPTRSNPAGEQSPIIMKTYVVSKDMQTDMERENRLKNLSTL